MAWLFYFEEIKMTWLNCEAHRFDMRRNILHIIARTLVDYKCYILNTMINADLASSNTGKVLQLVKQKKKTCLKKKKDQESKENHQSSKIQLFQEVQQLNHAIQHMPPI